MNKNPDIAQSGVEALQQFALQFGNDTLGQIIMEVVLEELMKQSPDNHNHYNNDTTNELRQNDG